jgi:hypothetical protein
MDATNSARPIRMLGRGNANECAEVRTGRLAQAGHAICLWPSGLYAKQGTGLRALCVTCKICTLRLRQGTLCALAQRPRQDHALGLLNRGWEANRPLDLRFGVQPVARGVTSSCLRWRLAC